MDKKWEIVHRISHLIFALPAAGLPSAPSTAVAVIVFIVVVKVAGNFFIIFLQSGKVFPSFGELSLFHALANIPANMHFHNML
jgi:hypothetical protein